ncbi:uncharacterized protein Z518_03409 [Rhinocladiella mackenziei CBS 650.93]|uniref:Xylose isomerase-like TIM barrel domain-containing protein n=1 Tax=Rhinocladiella mackenziei CBS 650.93 TaxID=1442369 RepID=A0A0D2G2I2_9EURO|nr:uncharacterized protein Z518_03409 [Rhinocladiella mackenziei CBS 650.93]KIX08752.1 hypothetical protein Z518_03409 [Rhinocladiella mackenziei CBS 650.93]
MGMLQPAIASNSLGHLSLHKISKRLDQAAGHGFLEVEIVDDDLDTYAGTLPGGLSDANRLEAARHVRQECDRLGLSIIVFQPFRFYEGLLDRDKHEKKLDKLRLWMQIVKILRTTIIQIPTNWLQTGTTGDLDTIVQDLRKMADVGLEQDPVVSFAYEGVAWGKYIDTWGGTWSVVQKVNRSNFGLCLDTFHMAGRVWGDPQSQTGKSLNADSDFQQSLAELVDNLDISKVFYVQAGDAELLNEPLLPGFALYNPEQPPRMTWSRNARLFPLEVDLGGYLPIMDILDVLVNKLGYRGHMSLELFSRNAFGSEENTPEMFAIRAAKSWTATMAKLGVQ